MLDLVRLRHLAEVAGVGPGRTARWHRMIAYARTQGWLSADGGSVRAHVERDAAQVGTADVSPQRIRRLAWSTAHGYRGLDELRCSGAGRM
jgi:hypothetical protein